MTIEEWDEEISHDPTLITRYPGVAMMVEKARWQRDGIESVRLDIIEILDRLSDK